MPEYLWNDGARIGGVKAQAAGDALMKLAARKAGQLAPEDVVRAARPKRSPLHGGFEWDDVAAAEAFRLDQARGMLRSIRVRTEAAWPLPAFVSIRVTIGGEQDTVYTPIDRALGDAEFRAQVITRVQHDLEIFERRYRHYASLAEELSPVLDALAKARRQLAKNLA